MNEMQGGEFLIFLVKKACIVIIMTSMPAILTASLIGIMTALVQALMQLQDQTLTFAVKMFSVFFVLLLFSNWIGFYIVDFTIHAFKEAFENNVIRDGFQDNIT